MQPPLPKTIFERARAGERKTHPQVHARVSSNEAGSAISASRPATQATHPISERRALTAGISNVTWSNVVNKISFMILICI